MSKIIRVEVFQADLKPHVLRYWESQFRFLSPAKNRSGNRVYQRREVEGEKAAGVLHLARGGDELARDVVGVVLDVGIRVRPPALIGDWLEV